MPPVLISIGIAAVSTAAAYAVGAITLTAAFVQVGIAAALAVASYLLAPSLPSYKQNSASFSSAAPANYNRAIASRQPLPPRRYVFGSCRIAGPLFFEAIDNPDLYRGYLLSDGACSEVTGLYFGQTLCAVDGSGDALSGTIYHDGTDPYVSVEYGYGATTQLRSQMLIAVFNGSLIDTTFRQRGITRAVVRQGWGADASTHSTLWGANSSPVFQGNFLKCYDPRTAQDVDDVTTWTFTTNPALHILHALRFTWGREIDNDKIDFESFSAAADYCDTEYTIGGTTYKLFESSGIYQSDIDMSAQLSQMLSACAGSIYFYNGQYQLAIEKAANSVVEIKDVDVLEFRECRLGTPIDQKFNTIKAIYYDAAAGGERKTTPVYEVAGAVASEGRLETAIDLRFTPTQFSAEVLAYRTIMRMRAGKRATIVCADFAIQLKPLNVVTLNLEAFSDINGTYRVKQIDLDTVGVVLTLEEYASAAYNDPIGYVTIT